ncbi:sensor histidine kinase [Aneurinibacillus terranovensis]|uniref:sensor histidine kinase n=1 Tax=Aneurinibacillus terranovensis TaxID=278991 RepID=UPI0004265527|nr:sensor histidine kinase [Aneurinibacillus terranovensis]
MVDSQIYRLCMEYTVLTEQDIDCLIKNSEMIQTIADLSQANVFIDCPVNDGIGDTAIVVAEAIPATTRSLYEKSYVGKKIFAPYEPAVFRAYRTGRPAMMNRAVTQEGQHVKQNVLPIKNSGGESIGMLILEQDISLQVKNENELAILSETTEEFSRTFWDLIAKEQAIPDVIEEALVLLREDGTILYANNFAIGMIEAYSGLTRENYINKRVNEVIPFVISSDYSHNSVMQREVHFKDMVYILRGICLQQNHEARRILLYIRDITDLREKERQLMVKSAVIQEIHHRVKNNLQTVSSLLRLQLRRGVPDEAKSLYQESLNRINSIATIHEVLSYSGIEKVNMNQVIEKIAKMLIYNMQGEDCRVDIEVDIEDIELSSKQAVSLALILTELIQNSIKHGFTGRTEGSIVVMFHMDEQNRLYLSVQDDGVGLQERPNTDQLGLEIVRNLTHYDLSGRFEIGQNDGGGTKSKVTFPLAQE